ncbi:MAG TPA: hypothetical protein VFV52_09725 [Bacilli bacterium]|nr:hypothetical protein [Bacilli bacterium]
MGHYREAEYCDLDVRLSRSDMETFIRQLASGGVSLVWRDRQEHVVLVAMTGQEKREFCFQQREGLFVLTGTLSLQDERLVNALQQALVTCKGRAVVKHFTEGPIFISKYRNGEALMIMELHGPRKKVVYEKPIKITSEDIMKAMKNKEIEQRIPVLKLELDYELVSLTDALQANDADEVARVKGKLEELRRELLMLEAFDFGQSEVHH